MCFGGLTETTAGDVRVVNGSSGNAGLSASGRGLVQVLWDGVWGTLHQNGWSFQAARTVCRELGWSTGAPVVSAGTRYGRRSDPIINANWYSCRWDSWRLADCWGGPIRDFVQPENVTSFNDTAGVECRNGAYMRACVWYFMRACVCCPSTILPSYRHCLAYPSSYRCPCI
jgi:hypothetical protein